MNGIDTPGHADLTAEVERSLRVLDGAVACFDAVHGVQPQSEKVWRQADKYGVPRICFINKMDKMGADFEHAIETIRKRLNAKPIAIQLPVGAEANFKGVIDLFKMKAIIWNDETMGAEYVVEEIPENLKKKAEAFRLQMIESIAENDDEILHMFLEGEEIPAEKLRTSLRKSVIALKLFPVVAGSSFKNKGVQTLLDAVVDYLPSPLDVPPVEGGDPDKKVEKVIRKADDAEPFSGLAFKIMTDPFVGQLAFIRVYSGGLKTGDSVLNPRTTKSERIGRLLKMHANKREEIQEIYAGDICAAVGLGGGVGRGRVALVLQPGQDLLRLGQLGRGLRLLVGERGGLAPRSDLLLLGGGQQTGGLGLQGVGLGERLLGRLVRGGGLLFQ